MKNNSKGFIAPLLIAIIALLLAGGGYYLANLPTAPTSTYSVPVSETSTNTVTEPPKENVVIPPGIGRIQVTSPKGGEVWQIGSSYGISWANYVGTEPLTIALQTSPPTGQTSVRIIAQDVPAASIGRHTWTVPAENTNNKYKVEIYPAGGRELVGRSADYFTIRPAATKACIRGGCSGQLCVEQLADGNGPMTTCEYRAEYACYSTATCERQASGSCGWTQTSELSACLSNPPPLQ